MSRINVIVIGAVKAGGFYCWLATRTRLCGRTYVDQRQARSWLSMSSPVAVASSKRNEAVSAISLTKEIIKDFHNYVAPRLIDEGFRLNCKGGNLRGSDPKHRAAHCRGRIRSVHTVQKFLNVDLTMLEFAIGRQVPIYAAVFVYLNVIEQRSVLDQLADKHIPRLLDCLESDSEINNDRTMEQLLNNGILQRPHNARADLHPLSAPEATLLLGTSQILKSQDAHLASGCPPFVALLDSD